MILNREGWSLWNCVSRVFKGRVLLTGKSLVPRNGKSVHYRIPEGKPANMKMYDFLQISNDIFKAFRTNLYLSK